MGSCCSFEGLDLNNMDGLLLLFFNCLELNNMDGLLLLFFKVDNITNEWLLFFTKGLELGWVAAAVLQRPGTFQQ